MPSKTSVTIYSSDHEKLARVAAVLDKKEPTFLDKWSVADIIEQLVDDYLPDLMKTHGVTQEDLDEVEEY